MDPDRAVTAEVPLPEGIRDTDLRVCLVSAEGKTLVAWQPVARNRRPKPEARTVPPRPRDVASLEELYLHGAHLEQYKHHTYRPEDYYLEALERDSEDLRCNHAMGRLLLEKGDFSAARIYLDRAIVRLKWRNDNPADPEPLYQKGRLELLEGNYDEAYELFAAASWQFGWRSACLYEMACIDCRRGERETALAHLEECLETNGNHFAAGSLLGYLTGKTAQLEKILSRAPQDTFARYALWLLGEGELPEFIRSRPPPLGFSEICINSCKTPAVTAGRFVRIIALW